MGVVFSRLTLNRRSTGNRYSGHLKPSRPSCRSVNSARAAVLGNMLLIGPGCLAANFVVHLMDGTRSYHYVARSIGFTCQSYPPRGHRFQSNCRSTPIPTYVCRPLSDFGAPSTAAVLVRLLLRFLPSVAGA